MPMRICNRFQERLANSGKIPTFTGVLLFDAAGFLKHRKSRLGLSKSTFSAEKFIRRFSMSICSNFGAIRS